ncbi:MAG: ankyrin repeat domain-containing protein [bacterium]|nr:ankyrin repeat domain-containing protein [bacterium]MDI1227810.1 ankyrin repeat domain-containing protein [bacterium]
MALFRSQKEFLTAAAAGDTETVSAYLSKKKKWLQAEDDDGNRAIHLAARHGHIGMVTLLLNSGAALTDHNRESWATPLLEAVTGGHTSLVKFMLEKETTRSISTAPKGMTPLQAAIVHERYDMLQMFIDAKKVDLTAGDPPAVYCAVMNNKPDALDILLSVGADPSVFRSRQVSDRSDEYFGYSYSSRTKTVYDSPLQAAVTRNSTEMLQMLLERGAKKTGEEHPLHGVAAHGNIEAATLLLQHGIIKIGDRNDNNRTALHSAAEKNQPEMARFLLAQGIDKNIQDKDKRTALSYAQQFAMKEMIELLQGPLPPRETLPIRKVEPPSAAPVIEVKPVPAAVVVPVAQPVVIATPPGSTNDVEVWTLAGTHSIAHITVMPVLNKKLTELFNFESRERVTFAENLATKAELMGPQQSFDTISDDALLTAFNEYKRLGGKADEDKVFRHNLNKTQLKKPAGI